MFTFFKACFITDIRLHLKDGTRVKPLARLHSNGRLLALPTSIGLWWKRMEVTNTLAFYYTNTFTVVKSFIAQVLGEGKYILFYCKVVKYILQNETE